jgi:hypothetical protein
MLLWFARLPNKEAKRAQRFGLSQRDMSFEEAATALDIAVPTAKQWWAYARAWLVEMRANPPR